MDHKLNTAGWIFMLISCGAMTILVTWCFWKVLTLPPGDTEEPDLPPGLGP